jgi:hypothetical protein
MRTGGCFQFPRCDTPQFGLGAGAALNLTPHLALDSSFNLLPGTILSDAFFTNGSVVGGRATEFLAGARSEVRSRSYGYFLEAQPGLVSWSAVPTGEALQSAPNGTVVYTTHGRRTFFASKVGAGLEFSPGTRLHLRVDFGDLLIRYGHSALWTCSKCVTWTNNPQATIGIYAGLGKAISWKPPNDNPRTDHPFFGGLNLPLIGASLLAITADAVTTQRFISHGLVEGDPFARPLVKYGWSGQVAASGLEFTGEILGMYGLHKIGQHWIERLLLVGISAAHGVLAYNNTKVSY